MKKNKKDYSLVKENILDQSPVFERKDKTFLKEKTRFGGKNIKKVVESKVTKEKHPDFEVMVPTNVEVYKTKTVTNKKGDVIKQKTKKLSNRRAYFNFD